MGIMVFLKLFVISVAVSLIFFALDPTLGLLDLAKFIALGAGISIIASLLYPSFRGIQKGDKVSVVFNSVIPSIFGKGGIAMSSGKLNSEIRIRLDDGREAVGVIESYEGLPFTKRWLIKKFGAKANFALRELKQLGMIHEFPPLVEINKGIVSQAEHSVLIDEKGEVVVFTNI